MKRGTQARKSGEAQRLIGRLRLVQQQPGGVVVAAGRQRKARAGCCDRVIELTTVSAPQDS